MISPDAASSTSITVTLPTFPGITSEMKATGQVYLQLIDDGEIAGSIGVQYR